MSRLKSFENDLEIWVPRTIGAGVAFYFFIGLVGIGVEKIHNFYLDNGLLSIILIIISLGIIFWQSGRVRILRWELLAQMYSRWR